MTKLKFNELTRAESNPQIIETLLRKGWQIVEQQSTTQPPKTESEIKAETYFVAVENGFLVEPENFVLALHDQDRLAFTQMLSLIKEALDLGLITNETTHTILDKNGSPHQVTTLRFRQIMVQYGFYYKTIWDDLNA
jgi:hypothetical protein